MKIKKTKIPTKVPATTATAAAPPPLSVLLAAVAPPLSPPLGDLVSTFLYTTAYPHSNTYHQQLFCSLKHLAANFGYQPIGQVSSQQIEHLIVSNQHWGSRTRQLVLCAYKTFFYWARCQGHLPQHLPTAADLVNLHIRLVPPQIILAPGLGQLLHSTQDPDILMPTVCFAFAGPLVAELQRLGRGDIKPRQSILLNAHKPGEKRLVSMPAVLDAWLLPFYGYPDMAFLRPAALQKFRRWARALNLRFLPRILRNSFIAHGLAQSGNPYQTAREAGLRAQFCHKCFSGLVARNGGRNYFSNTPAQVGLPDWPRLVKQYLAQNSRRRRVKKT